MTKELNSEQKVLLCFLTTVVLLGLMGLRGCNVENNRVLQQTQLYCHTVEAAIDRVFDSVDLWLE